MFKTLFSILFAGFLSFAASAQTSDETKVGYADVDYILSKYPAAQKLTEHLQTLEADLVKNYQAKETEFKTKYEEFVKAEQAGTLLPALRDNTIRELQMLEENLNKFRGDIQKTLQDRRDVLSMPVFKSIGDAIDSVARDNGYTMILSSKAAGIALILSGDKNLDISDLVLKTLGVTPGATPPATSTTAQPAATTNKPATTKAPANPPAKKN